jgi:hypothetical protein
MLHLHHQLKRVVLLLAATRGRLIRFLPKRMMLLHLPTTLTSIQMGKPNG